MYSFAVNCEKQVKRFGNSAGISESQGTSGSVPRQLESAIDPTHELMKLSAGVEGSGLLGALLVSYWLDNGRPGGLIRLVIELQILKDVKGLSGEKKCAVWHETPYFQHFCGEEFF